jgi:hypothetical protein
LIGLLLYTVGTLHATPPTKTKSWGVEINPLSLTILGSNSEKVFSGVVSRFDNDNATEMALSLVYAKEYSSYNNYYQTNNQMTKTINIALHYRQFIKDQTKGFYYGGFGSYTSLDGKVKDDIHLATVTKVGIGAEIGFRLMKPYTDWSIYWGPALRIGRYFGSNNDVFEGSTLGMSMYDSQLFFDVDFLRIGYRF